MKKKSILLICFFAYSLSLQAQTKRALLIGVSTFNDPAWEKLGCDNDMAVMSELLTKQGFSKENLTIVSNDKATRAGVAEALKKFETSLKAGDVALIQFSSHGVQIEDFSDDEADGLDEAIVCYDSPLSKEKLEVNKEFFLLDEDLGVFVESIRSKLGPKGDLVMLMDFCHAGSSTRGGQGLVARGGYPALTTSNFTPRGEAKDLNETTIQQSASRGGSSNQSPYVIYSAAQAHQLDFERDFRGKNVGALTYAVAKALSSTETKPTYEGLFGQINKIVQEESTNQGQTPVMEGDGGQRQIFGGDFKVQEKYHTVSAFQDGGKTLKMESGELMGLTIGSEIMVCPTATLQPTEQIALAKGKVISVDPFTALVELDKSLIHKKPQELWVFVTKQTVSFEKVTLAFLNSNARGMGEVSQLSPKMMKDIREKTTELPSVAWGQAADIVIGGKGDSLDLIYNATGNLMARCHVNDLNAHLQEHVKFKTFKKLETGEDWRSRADIFILPKNKDNTTNYEGVKDIFINGNYVIKKDAVKAYDMVIKNTSDQPFYVNLVYLDTHGQLNCFFPRGRNSAEDCLVTAGESITILKNFKVSTADGVENFKVIISPVKIDMRRALNAQVASRGGGDLTSLETIFGKLNEKIRAVTPGELPEEGGVIGTFSFTSVE
jgi:hypothetical protein